MVALAEDKLDQLTKLRRLRQLQAQKLRISAEFGLLSYQPHEKQDAFHRAGHYKFRLISSGNRFGKSQAGAAEICAWLLGKRYWMDENDTDSTKGIPQKANKILVITTDWDKVEEVFTSEEGGEKRGKLFQLLPSGSIKRKRKNQQGVIDTIYLHNGSYIKFETINSFKHNEQTAESVNWDAIQVDEPCPKDMWTAVARGLMDTNGKAWFTLTPLAEPWIDDMFFPNGQDYLVYPYTPTEHLWAIRGSTYDNPHLDQDAVDIYAAGLDEDERKARIEGIPLYRSGLVYTNFARHEHVLGSVPHGWEAYDDPPSDYIITVAMDVHPSTNHAVLFTATDPLDNNYIYDEIWSGVDIDTLALLIKDKLKGRRVGRILCDPIAWINDPVTSQNMASRFFQAGLPIVKAPKAVMAGILIMQANWKKRPLDLYVSPKLARFLWEINRYRYDKKTNKPIDKDDHMMENLYRTFYNRPRYHHPQNDSPVRVEEQDASLELDDLDYLTNDIPEELAV